MKLSFDRQRTYVGGWILMALIIGTINTYWYISMENQSLSGYSQTIKMLQVNLQQFDKTLSEGLFSLAHRLELSDQYTSEPDEDKPKKNHSVTPSKKTTTPTIVLPSLTGIMQVLPPDGKIYYQAILNGRICKVTDKIDDFRVMKISPAGVEVKHSGLKWTIEFPKPYYSSDQGN